MTRQRYLLLIALVAVCTALGTVTAFVGLHPAPTRSLQSDGGGADGGWITVLTSPLGEAVAIDVAVDSRGSMEVRGFSLNERVDVDVALILNGSARIRDPKHSTGVSVRAPVTCSGGGCPQVVTIDAAQSEAGGGWVRGNPFDDRVRTSGGETSVSLPSLTRWEGGGADSRSAGPRLDLETLEVSTRTDASFGQPSEGATYLTTRVSVVPLAGGSEDDLELVVADPPFEAPGIRAWGSCRDVSCVDADPDKLVPVKWVPVGFARFRSGGGVPWNDLALIVAGLMFGIAGSGIVALIQVGPSTSVVNDHVEGPQTDPEVTLDHGIAERVASDVRSD